MNTDVSYLEDCNVPCLPSRTHCLHRAVLGLEVVQGLQHFNDQHFDGPNKLHVCCHCWVTAGQDADGIFHFPVNPEVAALRKDAERYRLVRDGSGEVAVLVSQNWGRELDRLIDAALADKQERAEVAALRKDAERYRWLANRVLACDYGDNDATGEQIEWRIRHDLLSKGNERQPAFMYGTSIDKAIDAAIADKQEKP